MRRWVLTILIFILILANFSFVFSAEKLQIHFFYSTICPRCAVEQKFLEEIEQKYPEVEINRYLTGDPKNQDLLRELSRQHNAERYIGLVPLTFVGEDFFLGFDNAEGIGKKIENSIQGQIGQIEKPPTEPEKKVTLPLIGELDTSKYSLPLLTIVMGALDGLNICSLGALVLILGLVLALRSRTKILILGSIFVLTTALVYGLLIVLWYELFSFLSPYLKAMEILIGTLGIGGGIYFLRQFIKFRKQGPVCEAETGGIVSRFSYQIKEAFKKPGNILGIIGAVFLFAGVITIVEFPCSAAVPVVFAGLLAKAKLSTFSYLFYIALFVLFYMLDEILIFLVAVFKMTVWLASPKFVTWVTLIEAIFLFLLGVYYLVGL